MTGVCTMKIEHIALWTNQLEEMKEFYSEFFQGKANEKYINASKQFESYFLTFESGARLELMRMLGIPDNSNDLDKQYIGLIHIAFSVGSKENVDALTDRLKQRGYRVISGPRTTGDGYYESCILDPDGNRVEIVA